MSCQQASRLILVLDHVLRLSWLPVSFSSWVQNSDWLVIDWLIVWLPQGAFRRLLDPIRPRGILRPHFRRQFWEDRPMPHVKCASECRQRCIFSQLHTVHVWLVVSFSCLLTRVSVSPLLFTRDKSMSVLQAWFGFWQHSIKLFRSKFQHGQGVPLLLGPSTTKRKNKMSEKPWFQFRF